LQNNPIMNAGGCLDNDEYSTQKNDADAAVRGKHPRRLTGAPQDIESQMQYGNHAGYAPEGSNGGKTSVFRPIFRF
jgi:hypothetical protein